MAAPESIWRTSLFLRQFAQNYPRLYIHSRERKFQPNGKPQLRQPCNYGIGHGDIAASITVPNRSGAYDITVEKRAFELREVVVKAKKIYSQGDTIDYNVASFLSQSDRR